MFLLFRPKEGANRDQYVYLFVFFCLSAHIIETVPYFLFILTVAVARSFSGGSAIRYVLPVLWMT